MAGSADLRFSIIIDDKGSITVTRVKEGVNQLKKETDKSTQAMVKQFDSLWRQMALGQMVFDIVRKGFNQIAETLKSSINLYIESEKIEARLVQTIKNLGDEAIYTVDQLKAMTTAYMGMSTFDDEAITGAQAMLLTFRSIGKDVFPEVLKAAMDVSEFLGNDLSQTAFALGKAMEAPEEGFRILKGMGVVLNDSLKETIITMMKHGQVAEAQGIILKTLKEKYGGAAEAATKTFGGSLKQLSNQLENIKEDIGKALLESLIPLFRQLAEWIIKNKDTIINFTKTAISTIADVIKTLWDLKGVLIIIAEVWAGIWVIEKIQLASIFLKGMAASSGELATKMVSLGKNALMAGAAIAGWEIGTWINNVTGLRVAVFKLNKEEVELTTHMSNLRAGFTDHAKANLIVNEAIMELGKKLGIASGNIGTVSKAIFDNKEQFKKLSPEIQNVIKAMAKNKEINIEVEKQIKKNSNAIKDFDSAQSLLEKQFRVFKPTLETIIADMKSHSTVTKLNDELTRRFDNGIKDLNLDFYNLTGATEDQLTALSFLYPVLKGIVDQYKALKKQQGETGESTKEDTKSWQELKAKMEMIIPAIEGIVNLFGNLSEEGKDLISSLLKMGMSFGEMATTIKEADRVLKLYNETKGEGATLDEVLTAKNAAAAASMAGLTAIISFGTKVLKGLFDIFSTHTTTLSEFRKQLKDSGATLEELTNQEIEYMKKLEEIYNKSKKWQKDDIKNMMEMTQKAFDLQEAEQLIIETLEKAEEILKTGAEAYGKLRDSFSPEYILSIQEEMEKLNEQMAAASPEELVKINEQLEILKKKLSTAKDIQAIFGSATSKVFEKILAYQKLVATNQDLVNAINSWSTAFDSLYQIGSLNNQTFETMKSDLEAMASSADEAFQKLIDQGFSGDEALKMLSPTLKMIHDLMEKFGLKVDDGTAALIEMADKKGLLDDLKTPEEQMIDLLQQLVDLFSNKLPDAIGDTQDAVNNLNIDVPAPWDKWGAPPDWEGNYEQNNNLPPDVYGALGVNSILNRDTKIQAHKGEHVIIIPKGEKGDGKNSDNSVFQLIIYPSPGTVINPEMIAAAIKSGKGNIKKAIRDTVKERL